MREFRQDLTGNTDANGNATIRVPMPQTGEWHNLKFAMSTTAAAEWAVQLTGSTVTYGRGRRVTLGPELVRDNELVTITVTGGPVSAAISGTASGVSGAPDHVVATFVPQPNTIATDVLPSGSVLVPASPVTSLAPAITVNLPPLSPGTTYIRVWMALTAPTTVAINGPVPLVGFTTQYYREILSASSVLVYRDVAVDPSNESLLKLINNGPGTISQLVVTQHSDPIPEDQFPNLSAPLPAGSAERPWDWQIQNTFDGPIAAPSLIVAIPTGKTPVLRSYSCTVISSGGAYVGTLTFSDTIAGQFWNDGVGVQAVNGVTDHARATDLAALGGLSGVTLTMALNNALIANTFARMAAGGHFV